MSELLGQLTAATGLAHSFLWAVWLVFLRVGAVMALLPAFGETVVPARVKLALTVAFTAIVAPAVADQVAPLDGRLALPLVTEVAAGLIIGIGLRLFILALQTAGAIVAQATSLAQIFGGAGLDPQAAIGHLFTVAGLALAAAAGLHVRAAELMILSYEMMPPGALLPGVEAAQWGLAQITRAFALAFSLAAPFVIAAAVYNAALGVINRAMPQLSVVFVGAPLLTFGGLALLLIATPLLLSVWMRAFEGFLQSPFSP